jgi:Ca2+-binding EF-hand superfamily protein
VLLTCLVTAGDNASDTRPSFRPDGPPPFCPEWIQEHFAELDQDQNGALSAAEIAPPVDEQTERPLHPDFLSRLDANGDGEIQVAELKAISEERAARQKEFFGNMDKDGDESVSFAEFQAFRPEPKGRPRDDSRSVKEKAAGQDRPPERGFVPPANGKMPPPPPDHAGEKCERRQPPMPAGVRPSPEEMTAHFTQMQQEMFERLDENGDGRLHLNEIKNMRHFGPPPLPPEDFGMQEGTSGDDDDVVDMAAAGATAGIQPTEFRLAQNYPNPFNFSTTIAYDIPVACHVMFAVYNVSGELVKTLVDEDQPASHYQLYLRMADETSGQYFCRLQAGSFSDVQKMTYVK